MSQRKNRSEILRQQYLKILPNTSTAKPTRFGRTRKFRTASLELSKKVPSIINDLQHRFHLNNIPSSTISILTTILDQIIVNVCTAKKQPTIQIKAIINLFPRQFFGSYQNERQLQKLIIKIATHSANETYTVVDLCENYELGAVDWLQDFEDEKLKSDFFYYVNQLSLEFIIKPVFAYFYKPLRSLKDYRIQFVLRSEWNSFEDKAINKLITDKFLVPSFEQDQNSTHGDFLIMKKGASFRAIVNRSKLNKQEKLQQKRENQLVMRPMRPNDPKLSRKEVAKEKRLQKMTYKQNVNRKILAEIRERFHPFRSLYKAWKEFCVNTNDGRIFGVTLDLEDAFGNVDMPTLLVLLNDLESLSSADKEFVTEFVSNQFVSYRGKIYKWCHGLLQGDSFSTSLCELFLVYTQAKLNDGFNKKTNLIYRFVDDYIFCSTSEHEVTKFIEAVKELHKVNNEKTKTNVPIGNLPISNIVYYCGNAINLDTKEVEADFKLNNVTSLRFKCNFFSVYARHNRDEQFLEAATSIWYNNYYLQPIYLNTHFNTHLTVYRNIYNAMIWFAFKIDAALTARGSKEAGIDFILQKMPNFVEDYTNFIMLLVNRNRGDLYEHINRFSVQTLIYNAFHVVFCKRKELYVSIVNWIRAKRGKLFIPYCYDLKYFKTVPAAFHNLKSKRDLTSFGML